MFVLAFIFLNVISVYSYLNFGYYASVADNVRETLETIFYKNITIKEEYESLWKLRKGRAPVLNLFANVKSKKLWKK